MIISTSDDNGDNINDHRNLFPDFEHSVSVQLRRQYIELAANIFGHICQCIWPYLPICLSTFGNISS